MTRTPKHRDVPPDITDAPRPVPFPDIAYTRFRLANGLTLIVHEDRSAPLIATELRYNVGSKDEPPGRFGFAHLFEHLMFGQSANRQGNWHVAIGALGGSNVNGTTSYDRTNYYQTVPTGAIDTLLWMESDRMGHLLQGLTDAALAAEIDIVKNEKRQRESAPMGSVAEAIADMLYPAGHPYGHAVIGTFADLDRATLPAAHDWYRRWYGAGNAILAIAGDIAAADALAKVEHWFGDLPRGPAIRRPTRWLPPRQGAQRLLVEEQVASAGLVKVWSVPPYGDPDTVDLGMIAAALTGAPDAALTRRLVEEERLCTAVEASVERRFLCSEFCISATFAPGIDGARVEAIIDAELATLLAAGPTPRVLDDGVRGGRLDFIRSSETLAIRAELLAASEMSFGAPDGYRRLDAIAATATPVRVAAAGRRWLGADALTLDVRPFTDTASTTVAPDRTRPPPPGPVAAPRFPKVHHAILSNGIPVRLAHRPGSATVATVLLLPGGTGGDAIGAEGLTAFTLAQIAAGTHRHGRLALAERQRCLNSRIVASAEAETVSVRCDSLRGDYTEAVALMAECARSPAYPADDHRRARATALDAFDHERPTADDAAARAAAALTFGREHMLGRRLSGTREGVARTSRDSLVARHAALFRPGAAALFVVGDLSIDEARDTLEAAFGGWRAPGGAAVQRDGTLSPRPGRYLIARQDAPQSVIQASIASPAFSRAHAVGPALGLFGHIVGGSVGSRLNRSLREERGWTYGVGCGFGRWSAIGNFTIRTAVQADRTIDTLDVIQAALRDLVSDHPITPQELDHARTALLFEAPGYWTNDDRILAALVDSYRHDLPEGHHDRIGERLAALSLTDINAVAAAVADPAALTMVVAGDPAAFDAAGLTPVTEDGEPACRTDAAAGS